MADDDEAGSSWSDIPGRGFARPPAGGGFERPPAPGGEPSPYVPPPAFEPPAPPRRRSSLAVVAIAVGVLATLGGAVFAATQLMGDEGTPEEAVERLFDAVADEDVLGILEALPPSERDPLKDSVDDIVDEAKRLELLSGDVDLRKVSGLDFTVEGLRLSTAALADNFSTVTIEAGTFRTATDPARLPLGDFVKDIAGDALREAEPTTDEDPADGDGRIVAVKEDGKWYVSLWYSLAESGRRDSGAPVPDFGNGVKANGAESPEAAVEELLRAGSRLELRRLIELLPPDEARALHDYAPLFLSDAENQIAEMRQFFDIDVPELEVEADTDGDHSVVKVRKLAFEGTFGEEGEQFRVSYRDGCATMSGGGEEQRVCPGDFGAGAQFLQQFGFGFGGPQPPEFDVPNPDVGVVAVRRDGRWYVSPTRTLLEGMVGVMKVFDRPKLDEIRRYFEQLSGGFGRSFEDEGSYSSGEEEGPAGGPGAQLRECMIANRTLRTAEEAYFAQNGRYADEPTLVEAGFLSEESDLYDVSLSPDAMAFSLAPTGPACGDLGN